MEGNKNGLGQDMQNTVSFAAFMAQNAVPVENERVAASRRFKNPDGTTAMFEIRAISSAEDETLRRECMRRRPMTGKPGRFNMELDANLYMGRLAAACTAVPDLYNEALQDSYGVMEPDALLKAMLLPGEYADYLAKVQQLNGFDIGLDELKQTAKNS